MIERPRISVVGPTYEDHTIYLNGILSLDGSRTIKDEKLHPGGTGLCYAIALARQDARVQLYSIVGDDDRFGRIQTNIMNQDPDLELHMQVLRGEQTDGAVLFIDEGNHKAVASRRVVSERWEPDCDFVGNLSLVDGVVFTSFSNAQVREGLRALERLGDNRPFVMWAPHHGNCVDVGSLAESLRVVDHVTLSAEEFEAMSLDVFQHGVSSVTVTNGKHGTKLLSREGNEIYYPPQVVHDHPIDTNGAGEAFGAGFLAAYLRTNNLEHAVRCGNNNGAAHVMRKGADFPRRREISFDTICNI